MPRNLFVALFISSCLALLLSSITHLTMDKVETHIATFQPDKPVVLSEQNLVDLFTFHQTHYNIKRVKWENKSVYVDFVVTPHDKLELPLVYRDFYSLTYDLFKHTVNTEQVYFRLLEESSESPAKLLVAIEASRPKERVKWPEPSSIAEIESYVDESFDVRIDPFLHERVSPQS